MKKSAFFHCLSGTIYTLLLSSCVFHIGPLKDSQPSNPTTDKLEFVLEDNKKSSSVRAKDAEAEGEIVIPSAYDGLPVTSVGLNGFTGTKITSLYIPDSVATIEEGAFEDCETLNEIHLGSGLVAIGENAFRRCDKLTDVIIPDNVRTIGGYAFRACYNLTNLTLGSRLETIGEGAFSLSDRLSILTLPESLITISYSAFSGCTALKSVNIPSKVASIESGAFAGCSSLEGFKVSEYNQYYTSVDSILFDKEEKTLVAFPDAKGSFEIPNGTLHIGGGAFSETISESIDIPDSVLTIGDFAFSSAMKLRTIKFGNSVASIGKAAFSGCNELREIDIPDNVSVLGEAAFSSTGITSFVLPSRFTFVPDNLFAYGSLRSITLSENVASIGKRAFEYCRGLDTLIYEGTKFNWVTLRKEKDWNNGCPLKSVTCSDGIVEI